MLTPLEATISQPRLATYLSAAGYNEARALQLYRWNAQLGEAFHLPVQAVEIATRNRISSVLVIHFGSDWWQSQPFLELATPQQHRQLAETRQRIGRRRAQLVTGQVVAGLSFGFWVSMLDPRFNPEVWSKSLSIAFPNLPERNTRQDAQTLIRRIADFRNRIWHHEPIFKDNTTARYGDCMLALTWLCEHKKAWIKPQCSVMQVVRQRP
jgi:hypothetical protein